MVDLSEPFTTLDAPFVFPVVTLFPVIKLFIDLSAKDGRNGSEGRNGVVPLILAIKDRVRLKGMINFYVYFLR